MQEHALLKTLAAMLAGQQLLPFTRVEEAASKGVHAALHWLMQCTT
jgi:hypothetical protein